ncbi:MAG: hypothetical protein AAGK09_00670 [Planctomycetota bacterium]
MFFLNLGYKWNLTSNFADLAGVVFLPSGNHCERFYRKPLPEMRFRLLDPQLYLSSLDPSKCKKVCGRLASFPWFNVRGAPEFDSNETTLTKWQAELRDHANAGNWPDKPAGGDLDAAASSAIQFQINIDCTHIITPCPLVTAREDEGATVAEWLDVSAAAADGLKVDRPLIASIALSEETINEQVFEDNGFIDTIVDQVTARDSFDGVYIVIVQTRNQHPFLTSVNVSRAYFELSRRLRSSGANLVLMNFCDLVGLISLAYGATGFASGPTQGMRGVSLSQFEDDGGGRALPWFYSHRTAMEFLSETDLDEIAGTRHLRRVEDTTEYSESLMSELEDGGSASSIPGWAESQNNVAESHKHFVERMIIEASRFQGMRRQSRLERVTNWLDRAEAFQTSIAAALGDERGRRAPVGHWLSWF